MKWDRLLTSPWYRLAVLIFAALTVDQLRQPQTVRRRSTQLESPVQ